MLHSYTRLFIHLIWSTKNRQRLLSDNVRPTVHRHLLNYARTNDIIIDSLAVQQEHVHVLVNLRSDQQVDNLVKLLKGESSHWINSENVIRRKFSWQRGYGAFSVSPSHIDAVRRYLETQDEHHGRRTFAEEWGVTLCKHGFSES